jgi:LL-diaminopimelate aminotransferase
MKMVASERIQELTGYAFSVIDEKVAELKRRGIAPVDFGVGDPHEPPFPSVVRRTKEALDENLASGYPSYIGAAQFRREVSEYYRRVYGVPLDPETEVVSSLGSKEMIFNFHEAFVDPGDTVIVPNPAYPPYIRGTRFAEGKCFFVNLLESNRFVPDLDSIPKQVWQAAKLIWVCYPNNPTTVFAPDSFYEKLVRLAREYEVIIGSDEAYVENYYGQRPRSILEFTREGVVSFQSFSKMANMTMFRVGFVAGDSRIVSQVKKLKTNIDSGTPTFVQLGALAALTDTEALAGMRAGYRAKLEVLRSALRGRGFPEGYSDGTIYLWQKAPSGMDGMALAQRFLAPDLGLVVTPGGMLSREVDGVNPGKDFVRFALTPTLEEMTEAARRIERAAF